MGSENSQKAIMDQKTPAGIVHIYLVSNRFDDTWYMVFSICGNSIVHDISRVHYFGFSSYGRMLSRF